MNLEQVLYVLVIVAFLGYIALAIFFMWRAFRELGRRPCALQGTLQLELKRYMMACSHHA